MKRSSRPPAELSKSITQQLNMYAVAASAAGVGVLALSQPAEAKIIYAPAHQIIDQDHGFSLDLNHDGVDDFRFSVRYGSVSNYFYKALNVAGVQSGDSVRGKRNSRRGFYASRLPLGVRVGPKGQVPEGIMASVSGVSSKTTRHYRGLWAGKSHATTTGYLGFKFVIKGEVHYAWARLRVKKLQQYPLISALLTGFAYETTPNKPIITGKMGESEIDEAIGQLGPANFTPHLPEPATLGLLAMGAPGVSVWRREESTGGTH
jgi:hypothetical protein